MRDPVLIFDGECSFCTSCARFLKRRLEPGATVTAWQLADLDSLGMSEAQAREAVQWVEADGWARSGHEAIAAALRACGPIWRLAGRLLVLPVISPLSAKVYELVAANRGRLPGGTPACKPSAPTK